MEAAVRDFKRKLYENLDPNVPIDSEDERYVALYHEPNDPIRRIVERIDLSRGYSQSHHFLSGNRGSGKSTELKRLTHELQKMRYFVISIDVLEYLNPFEAINIDQLLVVLGAAFSERVSDLLQVDLARENRSTQFWNFLTKTNVLFDGLDISIPGFATTFRTKLKTTSSIRQKISDKLRGTTTELREYLEDFIIESLNLIKERFGSKWLGFVFIVDSLEQLKDPSLGRSVVMDSVERVFTQDRHFLQLKNLHVVYTVPPWLPFRSPGAVGSIQMLPCVKLWSYDREPRSKNESGWETLRKLVTLRVEAVEASAMPHVFGQTNEEGLFPLLESLIENSGGHFRDLLLLVREALITSSQLQIVSEDVELAIAALRLAYPLSEADAVWLKDIYATHNSCLPDTKAETIGQFTMFLDNHAVLLFRNGEEWYDIHPVIVDNVRRIALGVERKGASKVP